MQNHNILTNKLYNQSVDFYVKHTFIGYTLNYESNII